MKNLLDICLELHQANMGSHEPDVSTTEYKFQYNLLRNKIENWNEAHQSAENFDRAVRTLILTTIIECETMNSFILNSGFLGDTDRHVSKGEKILKKLDKALKSGDTNNNNPI